MNATIEKQQQEIEAILKERIELAQKERTAIREALTALDAKIKVVAAKFAANGLDEKRPRETVDQITAQITELEYAHVTTSQSKAQERELLKTIQKLQQKKKSIALHGQIQAEIDELKAQRTAIAAELKGKDEGLEELHLGLRRVRTAMSLHVGIGEVISQVCPVPEDRLPQVIGKGGSNLRQIENDFGVSIESERYGSNELNILGTPSAIQLAVKAINTVVNTIAEEFTTTEQSIIVLTMDKAALLQEFQTRYNVRIETNRSKRSCKIVGLSSIVEIVKKEILSLHSTREEVVIDMSLLPHIVGKNGTVVRSIGEDNHVHIDINRDESKIVVMGLREGVINAVATIRSIADENKEIEEKIQIEKQIMIGCVIGPAGATIRSIQQTFNVSLKTEKGTDIDTLHIIGTTAKVLAAKQHVLTLIHEYSKNSETIPIPSDCMPIILGKKGTRINALREEHSSVNIDVDDNTIRICGGTAEARTKAKDVIVDIVAANWSHNLPCESDICIVLKSAKGTEIRQQLVTTLNLNVDIDTEKALIKLRGYKENVEKGTALINNFLSGFQTIMMDLTDEDCASLMNGSNPGADSKPLDIAATAPANATTIAAAVAAATAASSANNFTSLESHVFSPTKYVEIKYNVEVYINRKECRLRLRGPQSAIELARANILGILHGDPSYGAILIPIDPLLYATIIGKAGSNLKKMESDLSVKFDILKSKSLLRIRGTTENVLKAKDYVIDFMDNIRAATTINVPTNMHQKELDRILEIFINLYSDAVFTVNTQSTPKVITIRGSLLLIEEAKTILEEYLKNSSIHYVKLPLQYADSNRFDRAWKKIRETCSVTLEINPISVESGNQSARYQLVLSGNVENVLKAKKLLFDALMTILPASTFFVIYMTSDQLRSIALQKHIRDILAVNQLEDVIIDRQLACIRLMSSVPESVNYAAYIIQQKLLLWNQTHYSVGPVDGLYVWPMLVGKNNEQLSNIEKTLGVQSVSFNRSTKTIIMEILDNSNVEQAITSLNEKLDKIRSEYFEMELDENLVKAVIGKQGINIAKFRAELQASIDLDNSILKISGTADQVSLAKTKILEFIEEEKQRNYTRVIYVPVGLIPRLIGLKGSNIREIQQDTETKIDLDKENERGTIRGSIANVEAAISAIQHFFESENVEVDILTFPEPSQPEVPSTDEEKLEERPVESEPAVIQTIADSKLRLPPGAQPKLGVPINKNLSKSALKRLKKKEKAITAASTVNSSNGAATNTVDDDFEDEIAESSPVNNATTALEAVQLEPLLPAIAPDSESLQISAPQVTQVDNIQPVSATKSTPIASTVAAPSVMKVEPASSTFVNQTMLTSEPLNEAAFSFASPVIGGNASISSTDSLLSILLGRTPTTTSTETAILNALHGSSTQSSIPSTVAPLSITTPNVAAQAPMASSPQKPVGASSTATTTAAPPVTQAVKSTSQTSQSSPSYALGNGMNSVPSTAANQTASNNYANYNTSMSIHIQQQAQQSMFNALAPAYAPMQQVAPPGFSNPIMHSPYGSTVTGPTAQDMGYPGYFSDIGVTSGNDFSFPLSNAMDRNPAGKSQTSKLLQPQQMDYNIGYGGRANPQSNAVFAPPGLSMPLVYPMQSMTGTMNYAMNPGAGVRPAYTAQFSQSYPQVQQPLQQPMHQQYMAAPGYGYGQSLYASPPGKPSTGALSSNGSSDQLNSDDRNAGMTNGNYYRGNTKSTGGNYQMR